MLFNGVAIGGAVGMVVYMLTSTKLQEKKAKRRADEMLPDEVKNSDNDE